MSEVVSYKCPNCAAPLEFDIKSQNWGCKFCGSAFSVTALDQGDTQDKAPEKPQYQTEEEEIRQQVGEMFGEGTASYSCPSCGGRIITEANTASTFCAYCHNPTVIASQLQDDKRPVRLIPFQLEKEGALAAMQKLCKGKPLLPHDFHEYIEKGEITGLYVPFWLYSCDMDADMQGVAKNIRTWSDRNYRYTKTDTFRIERSGSMSFRDVPADGSQRMDDRLMQALEPFDYTHMKQFDMGFLSGHSAESYDVDGETASKTAYARISSGIEGQMRETVRGYSTFAVQNLHTRSYNRSTEYVMLPVWTLMANYKGKQYTIAVNGESGKIAGKLPLSMAKLGLWAGIVFAGVFVLVTLGGLFL